ncbi:hypothetical protein B0919_21585 [Hymenobacter sp. CRA2]|nr:hypothetical protein B0919_21585 [Hymenobacter sp. CRA2]
MNDVLGIEADNKDIISDLQPFDPSKIIVYSRDWTIETMFSQISSGNIDLDPSFQRRNAWNDFRRSKLVESLVVGYPVPEIVLAEDPAKKKSFIVIDGKQRLMTIAGFINPDNFRSWHKNKIKGLDVRKDINGLTFQDLKNNPDYKEDFRQFMNADLRCTIISNFDKDDVLYDIFYRLNTGSVPLSTQELRQVLNKGLFSDYLFKVTNKTLNLHKVLGLSGPDNRLRDVEIILRCLSFVLFGEGYTGNLKQFLDYSMKEINTNWDKYSSRVEEAFVDFEESTLRLSKVFDGYKFVGRKYTNGKIESRFNRALFEVQTFYFSLLDREINGYDDRASDFHSRFIKLCDNNDFKKSIESTTKTHASYFTRFEYFREVVNQAFQVDIRRNPFNNHVL